MSAHMPYYLGRYPDDGDWNEEEGAEAIRPTSGDGDELQEDGIYDCALCGAIRDGSQVQRVRLGQDTVYLCCDCLPEHVDELESLRSKAVA